MCKVQVRVPAGGRSREGLETLWSLAASDTAGGSLVLGQSEACLLGLLHGEQAGRGCYRCGTPIQDTKKQAFPKHTLLLILSLPISDQQEPPGAPSSTMWEWSARMGWSPLTRTLSAAVFQEKEP